MATQSINIKFPFQDSVKGFFLDTNTISTEALKSDILHVLLTQKGQRFFDPSFGTNLYKYLFEPADSITLDQVKDEANASLLQAMPNVQITNLSVAFDETNDQQITLTIVAQNSQDVFNEQLIIVVQL